MNESLHLLVLTPSEVILDLSGLEHVTVEGPDGSLGIRAGHIDLISPLTRSVVYARTRKGEARYAAVNRGVVAVSGGKIRIVTREAVVSEERVYLENEVIRSFHQKADEERTSRTAFQKMRLRFMRRMLETELGSGA
ncbi:MAG: hypothetical protein R6W82_09875 [bacterium]